MSGTVTIASSGEWQRILSSSTIVVADFYADWCGPCKMIAPTFESLSTKYTKPGKITFCKVNVDNHQSIAQSNGVSAMPTFLVFKSGSVIETIKGANPPALTAAVEKAVKLAGTTAPGASFAIPGRTLGGGSGSGSGTASSRRSGVLGPRSWASFSPFNFFNALLTFFGLYIVSLLSFDPYKAAERSDFNVNKPRAPPAPIKLGNNRAAGGSGASSRPAGGVRTLADLGGTRAQRSCPRCRRQFLNLLENTFGYAQSDVSVLARYRPASQLGRGSSARLASKCFSTTRSRLDEVLPGAPSEAKLDARSELQSQTTPLKPTDDDIELMVRQTRHTFGDTLPKGYLNDDEYKIYKRLYGPPLRETQPGDVGMPIPSDAVEDEYGSDPSEKVLLRETEDGQFEEIVYETDEIPPPHLESSLFESVNVAADPTLDTIPVQELPSEAGVAYINAVAKNQREFNALLKLQKDFEAASLLPPEEDIEEDEPLEEQEEEEDEDEEDIEEDDGEPDATFGPPADRVHEFSQAGLWRTDPSTLHLPRLHFVAPITKLLDRTDTKHVREAAEKAFGGPGLPFSVATPKRNAEQKPVPMAAGHHKMSEIEADTFIATLLPGMYATTMSILVEVRKRLGTGWMAQLTSRDNGSGPRVLDVGAGGASLAAWEQVLLAEWERAKKKGSTPPGKKTAVVGSEHLRHRVSRFLHDTTFLPRLPDYLHSGDHPEKLEGGEASLPRKQFDIIIASHQMMPIKEGFRRKAMLDNLWEMLSPDGGVLIFIEKGHPRGFEAIGDVRARLLDEFIVSPTSDPRPEPIELETRREREPGMIIAPCTNHKACPMYLTPGLTPGRKDFCHFSQRFIRPPFLQKVLGATHRNHEDINFSFVAVQRGTLPDTKKLTLPVQGQDATDRAFAGYEDSPASPDPLSLPRNILPPMKRQGHVTFDVCTPAGTLERWTVPKSFSKQAYRDARKAKWGDLWALGAKTRVVRPVRLGKGGPVPNDGGVRAQRAARAGKTRVITLDADSRGIFRASEADKASLPRRRTKKGKKGNRPNLMSELGLEN
ncbi:mitochondrial small ribosomal subunit Rsm22-domain-containing protein [Xylaria venustula]|nr:mitochondrial small ribosomal subunit Rsm22-domain-containing protein [Xylaria venustula]